MMPYSWKNALRVDSSTVGASPPTKIFLVLVSFERCPNCVGEDTGEDPCPTVLNAAAAAGVRMALLLLLPPLPKMVPGGETVEEEGEPLQGGESSLGKALLASTSRLSIV